MLKNIEKHRVFFSALVLIFILSVIARLEKTTSRESSVDVEAIEIEISEYGIYKTERISNNYEMIQVRHVRLIRKTDRIPATLGTHFDVKFEVKRPRKGAVLFGTFIIQSPGFKKPGHEGLIYEEVYPLHFVVGKENYVGYEFSEEWELVPGDWAFQIFYKCKKLAEKTFTVYVP